MMESIEPTGSGTAIPPTSKQQVSDLCPTHLLIGIARAKATLGPPDYPRDEAAAKQKTPHNKSEVTLMRLGQLVCISVRRVLELVFDWLDFLVVVFCGIARRREA
jgi:hypothetical protein